MTELTQDALKHILSLADAARGIHWPEVHHEGRQGIVLAEGSTLLDLESYFDGRRQFRGTFQTKSLQSFVDYVSASKRDDLMCFINQDAMQAVSYLDMGDHDEPGHCRDLAALTLVATPIFAAVLKVDGAMFGQQEMAEWLEDWQQFIRPVDGDMKTAIRAVRTIDIKRTAEAQTKVGNMSESTSRLATVEATSTFTLPEGFIVTCNPYDELTARTVHLSLSVLTSDRPLLKLRVIGRAAMLESIGEEFGELLHDSLPAGTKALLGTFKP